MTKVWEFPNGDAIAAETAEEAAEELRERNEDDNYNPKKAKLTEIKDANDFEREFGTARQRPSRTESGSAEWLETYGKDLKKIMKLANSSDPKVSQTVWTVVEGDTGLLYLVAGYHYVNRLCYVISKRPWTTGQEVFLW